MNNINKIYQETETLKQGDIVVRKFFSEKNKDIFEKYIETVYRNNIELFSKEGFNIGIVIEPTIKEEYCKVYWIQKKKMFLEEKKKIWRVFI